jgi:hypothetical protein
MQSRHHKIRLEMEKKKNLEVKKVYKNRNKKELIKK